MYGMGQPAISEQCQRPPVEQVAELLAVIDPVRREQWAEWTAQHDATGIWAAAILSGDVETLAYEVCGGEDRRLTSPGGQALGRRFWEEYAAAVADIPMQPDYTFPPIDVTVSRRNSYVALAAVAAAALLLVPGKRRR